MKPFAAIATAVVGALCTTAAFASQPGNLMNMTTSMHMQMPGMSAMPPMTHTQKVCVSAQRPDPRDVMRNGGQCHVSQYKLVGNTVSYHVECGAPMQMSGDGTFTMRSDHGIHGSMHVTGNAGGQHTQMDMTIDGTRVGSCDYTPPATR
jgi:hypothetical protein